MKEKDGKTVAYLSDLARTHAGLYRMRIEESEAIVHSVIEAIQSQLMECDVLRMPGFGRFEHVVREGYVMRDNRPGQEGMPKVVPARYKIKFVPGENVDKIAKKYHQKMAARGEE